MTDLAEWLDETARMVWMMFLVAVAVITAPVWGLPWLAFRKAQHRVRYHRKRRALAAQEADK